MMTSRLFSRHYLKKTTRCSDTIIRNYNGITTAQKLFLNNDATIIAKRQHSATIMATRNQLYHESNPTIVVPWFSNNSGVRYSGSASIDTATTPSPPPSPPTSTNTTTTTKNNTSDIVSQLEQSIKTFLSTASTLTPAKKSHTLKTLIESCETQWILHPHLLPRLLPPADDLITYLLDDIQNQQQPQNNNNKRPLINRVLDGYSKITPSSSPTLHSRAAGRCHDILKTMENIPSLQPNHDCYNIVLTAFMKSDRRDAIRVAESILQSMTERSKSNRHCRPGAWTYSIVMDTIVKSNPPEVVEMVWGYLREMERISREERDEGMAPSVYAYSIVLNAMVKNGRVGEAEELLKSMVERSAGGGDGASGDGVVDGDDDDDDGLILSCPLPNDVAFGTVIAGYAQDRRKGNAEKAERVLELMLDSYLFKGNTEAVPTWVQFNHVMDAYAKSHQPQKSESLLLKMQHLSLTYNKPLIAPNIRSFGIVIDAWARYNPHAAGAPRSATISNRRHSSDRCLAILERMTTQTDLKPNDVIYNMVLNAIAKSGRRDSGERAERVLREMERVGVQPDVKTYTSVILAYMNSKIGNTSPKTTSLLHEFLSICRNLPPSRRASIPNAHFVRPDETIFAMAINAIAKSPSCPQNQGRVNNILASMMEWKHVQPTNFLYNCVLNMLAKDGDDVKARQVLEYMEQKGKEKGMELMTPNAVSYTTVIDAMARSQTNIDEDTVAAAEKLLDFCVSKQLHDIRRQPKKRQYKPTQQHRIHAFQSTKFELTTQVFNNTLLVLVRNKNAKRKAQRAWDRLQKMKDLSGEMDAARPNLHTYNLVLHACTCAPDDDATEDCRVEREEALSIAIRAFHDIRETIQRADSATYGMLFTICRRFISLEEQGDTRNDTIRDLFIKCCDDGLLNAGVLAEVKRACGGGDEGEELFLELTGGVLGFKDLPKEWSRNVQGL